MHWLDLKCLAFHGGNRIFVENIRSPMQLEAHKGLYTFTGESGLKCPPENIGGLLSRMVE